MQKRIPVFLCALLLLAVMIPAASAAGTPGIKLVPDADWHGLDIKLKALLDTVGDTANEGSYEFEYAVKPLANGGVWKILTQAGETPPDYARYTLRQEYNEAFTLKTSTRGDEENKGPIAAAELKAAADSGQNMRFCQQGTDVPYLITGITVTHIVGATRTVVYRLSDDTQFTSLVHGAVFEGTDILVKAGDFPMTVEVTETTPATQAPSAAPSATKKPAETNPKTGETVPIVLVVVLLIASAFGMFVLGKKSKPQE